MMNKWKVVVLKHFINDEFTLFFLRGNDELLLVASFYIDKVRGRNSVRFPIDSI